MMVPVRRFLGFAAAALAAALAVAPPADAKTIIAVMHSDLRTIDPLFTTAYITRDHGYMVYDTLLATGRELTRSSRRWRTGRSPTTS